MTKNAGCCTKYRKLKAEVLEIIRLRDQMIETNERRRKLFAEKPVNTAVLEEIDNDSRATIDAYTRTLRRVEVLVKD